MRTLPLFINRNFVNNSLIQIFISSHQVQARKIADNIIVYINNYDKHNIDELYNYILTAPKTLIDVVFLGDTCFRNISSCNMNRSEMRNILSKLDYNTVFFVRRKEIIEVCDINLNSFEVSIIKGLLSINARINSISCWPFWIVSNYFAIFPEDSEKFKCSMFVITTDECVDITAVVNGTSILCNRHFEKLHFSEVEIENTLQYVSEQTGFKLDEIAVYCINEETISTLTKKMSATMSFVSKVLPENIAPILDRQRKIVKTALRIVSGCLVAYLISQISELMLLNSEILEFEKIRSSVPEVVVSEMNLWENIKMDTTQADYAALVANILENTENSSISSIDITSKNSNLLIDIKMLDSFIEREYTKSFVFDHHKFNASVLEKGIICNGTPC